MADETNPTAPGPQTSEFKLTAIAMVLGVVLEGVAAALHALQASGVGEAWVPSVLAVVGALVQIASLFGYQKGRAAVKTAMILADRPTNPPPPS